MCNRPRRVGVVLAGGHSTRFGERDKALAEIDGTPMLRRVVDRVGQVTDAVVVNCRADQRDAFAAVLAGRGVPLAFAIDAVDDAGPLVGLGGALACHRAAETVVVACDMPFVDPEFLEFLCERRTTGGVDGVVPAPGGVLQPAQSVLSTDAARRASSEAVAEGESSLRSLCDRLDVARVDDETIAVWGARDSLRDVNAPDEFSDR